jgi:hypothetical protein
MDDRFEVHFTLTRDTPNSMNFADILDGLEKRWYKFESDAQGNITLRANEQGFEHLARFFLKMARSGKILGYHSHHTVQYGDEPGSQPELTIILAEAPSGFFEPS